MRKILCYIIVFLLPLTVSMMFFRKAAGNEEFGSFNAIYDYLQLYPVESLNDIKSFFVDFGDIIFENAEFEPDFSGSIFDDIAAIGQLIVDVIMLITNIIKWPVLLLVNIFVFFQKSLLWIINFIPYVVTY